MRNTSLAHHIVPGFVLYIKRHSSSSDRKRIVSNRRSRLSVSERTRLSITPDCRKTLVFSQKSQETCLQGSPPVHGRRPQCSNRQCNPQPHLPLPQPSQNTPSPFHHPHHSDKSFPDNKKSSAYQSHCLDPHNNR